MRLFAPSFVMGIAATLAALLAALSLWIAVDRTVIDLPEGALPLSIGGIAVEATDLIEEPDQLGGHARMAAFFERQSALHAALSAPGVAVTLRMPDGEEVARTLVPRPRGVGDLPAPFWFQLFVGVTALLIGAWVFALRREDWGARMFAVTGLCVPVFAMAAAIYSTRPVAMDGAMFRALSIVNHTGALAFGTALVSLFLMYPRPLVRPVRLLVPGVLYGAVIVGDALWIVPDGTFNLAILSQMLVAIALGVIQWVRSRREPLDRAGLRWFLLFSLMGCSLFVFSIVVPPALGLAETGLISQGYAFGFFLVMHVGLALGLTRYRVFELDPWAYRMWLWLGGAVLLFAVDFGILAVLRMSPWVSLSLALVLAGFLYFPLRQYVLERLFAPGRPDMKGRLPGVISMSFAPNRQERDALWDGNLRDTFDPLGGVEHDHPSAPAIEIAEQGLALRIPAFGDMPGRRLRYAGRGRRLFNAEDVEAGRALLDMTEVALESRAAYERGAMVERDRIARDMHDNIGAQLLSALHAQPADRKDELLRDALGDLRTVINEGFRGEQSLDDLVADLRIETSDRLSAAGIALDWPLGTVLEGARDISFPRAHALRSVLREAVNNVVKHSGAGSARIGVAWNHDTVTVEIGDDGRGIAPDVPDGNGLANMRTRATTLGGTLTVGSGARGTGTRVALALPLGEGMGGGAAAGAAP